MDVSDVIQVMGIEEEEKSADEIIRDGRNVYLRIPLDPGFEAGFAYRMISSVQPSCLLPLGIIREGHQVFADYQISGWTALSSVPPEDLQNLLYGIVNALKNAAEELSDCLLSADDLALEPGRVFLRRETGEIRFCYLLEGKSAFGESLQELMEFFIKNARPGGEQEVLLLYGLYQKSREENVTPEILASFRTELLNGQGASPKKEPPKAPQNFLDAEDGTLEIYERLGMDAEESRQPQKASEESRRSKKAPEETRKPQRASEETRRMRKAPEELPVRQIDDLEPPEEAKNKSFFRKHLPEILIGAAAVILAICALVL